MPFVRRGSNEEVRGQRMLYRRFVALLATILYLLVALPVPGAHAAKKGPNAAKYFAKAESLSRYVDLPNYMQFRYYAQNDALWNRMVYEKQGSKKYRPFGDGGCCPTSLAIALMQLVEPEDLKRLADYAKEPYSFCQHSVNRYFCSEKCTRFTPKTDEDWVRMLPLVLADFAMGNNTYNVASRTEEKGTEIRFIRYVAKVFGLKYSSGRSYEDALAAIRDGDAAVIAYCYKGSSLTNGGHYVALVHVDDEYLYVLDPFYREQYDTNFADTLIQLEPGVIAIRHKDVRYASFANFIILRHEVERQPIKQGFRAMPDWMPGD